MTALLNSIEEKLYLEDSKKTINQNLLDDCEAWVIELSILCRLHSFVESYWSTITGDRKEHMAGK